MHCTHKEWNERGCSAPQLWPGINLPCCSTRSESRKHPGWAYQRKYQSGVPHRGRISRVSDRDIGIVVRWGAILDNLISKVYTLNCVSSHSLRAGGGMAMKLSGASDSTIMRVRRWPSLTYLTYIHSKIGALTAGVAWKMSTAFTFQNVE